MKEKNHKQNNEDDADASSISREDVLGKIETFFACFINCNFALTNKKMRDDNPFFFIAISYSVTDHCEKVLTLWTFEQ